MTDVSVVTAAYNAAHVIERNIRSVGSQSLQVVEHIIVDDGSTDDTASIADKLRSEFPHVQVIRQSHGGASKARNAGISVAKGQFVAFLDSDDVWTKHKLEKQIGFMIANDVSFSYGDYYGVDAATGTVLGRYEAPQRLTYSDLLQGCPIGCLTVAFDQTKHGKKFLACLFS